MMYRFVYSERATKELRKLDGYTKRMIKAWIDKNLVNCADPRAHGRAPTASRKGQWRYRIGDDRLICRIEDEKLIVLALNVGHRSTIYTDR